MSDRLSRQSYIISNKDILKSTVLIICNDDGLLFEICRNLMCIGFIKILLSRDISAKLRDYKKEFFETVILELGALDDLEANDVCVVDEVLYPDIEDKCHEKYINYIYSRIMWDKSLSMVFVRSIVDTVFVTGDIYDDEYIIIESDDNGYKYLPSISNGNYKILVKDKVIETTSIKGYLSVTSNLEVGDRFSIIRPKYKSNHMSMKDYIDQVHETGNRYWDSYMSYYLQETKSDKKLEVDDIRVKAKLDMSTKTNETLTKVSHTSNIVNSIISCFSEILHINHQISFIPLLCKIGKLEKQYKILQIGCGATGCESAYLLCSIGQSNIILCDYDSFSYTNRNRQFLCSDKDVGRNKAEVCKERLSEMFSIELKSLNILVCDSNHAILEKIYKSLDVIICTVDNIEVRRYISRICRYYGIYMMECGTKSQFNSTYYYDPVVKSRLYNASNKIDQIEANLNCSPKSYCLFFSHCVRSSVDYYDKVIGSGKKSTAEEAFNQEYYDRHKKIIPIPGHLTPYIKDIKCMRYDDYDNNDFKVTYDKCKGPFDKDNDDHIDMIKIMTKIKCQLFGIDFIDNKNKIRKIAGHITPSVISSSSCAASQMISQMFNLDNIISHSYDMCHNSYMTYILSNVYSKDREVITIDLESEYYDLIEKICEQELIDMVDIDHLTLTNENEHMIVPKGSRLNRYCKRDIYRCTVYGSEGIMTMTEIIIV